MRRRAHVVLLCAIALCLAGLVEPPPAAAAAADQVVYVGTSNGAPDGGLVLRLLDRTSGSDTVLAGSEFAFGSFNQVWIAVSRNGRRIARAVYDSTDFGMRLDVYDRDTGAVVPLDHVGPDAAYTGLAWLPDGEHLLVGSTLPEGAPAGLHVIGLDGSSRALPGTGDVGAFDVSPSGLQIVYDSAVAGAKHIKMANVDGTSPVDLGVVGSRPRWSHDGTMILAAVDMSATDDDYAGSVAETFDLRGKNRTVHDTTFSSSWPSYSWSPDGAAILVGTTGSRLAGGSVREVSLATGAIEVLVPDAAGDAVYAAPWTPQDSTAPVLTDGPLLSLGNTSVAVAWYSSSVPGADVVGVRLALSPGLVPPASYRAGARRTTVMRTAYSTTFTGLVAGATYSYSMWSLDASGNLSEPRIGHFRLVPAVVSLTTAPLASTTSTGGWIRLEYATASPGAAGVILSYSFQAPGMGSSRPSAFWPGLQLAARGSYFFGRGGYPQPLVPGGNYRFCAGTRDVWGNPHWSSTCALSVFPLDDRDPTVAYAGTWTRVSTPGTWQGTTSMTSSGGAAAYRMPYRGGTSARRFTLLATTFATGGRFKVYVDGRYVATVSTRTSSTLLRRPVWTSSALTRTTHTLRIVQVAGSGWVRLDGLAVTLQ